jgi:hypothetical protein
MGSSASVWALNIAIFLGAILRGVALRRETATRSRASRPRSKVRFRIKADDHSPLPAVNHSACLLKYRTRGRFWGIAGHQQGRKI